MCLKIGEIKENFTLSVSNNDEENIKEYQENFDKIYQKASNIAKETNEELPLIEYAVFEASFPFLEHSISFRKNTDYLPFMEGDYKIKVMRSDNSENLHREVQIFLKFRIRVKKNRTSRIQKNKNPKEEKEMSLRI